MIFPRHFKSVYLPKLMSPNFAFTESYSGKTLSYISVNNLIGFYHTFTCLLIKEAKLKHLFNCDESYLEILLRMFFLLLGLDQEVTVYFENINKILTKYYQMASTPGIKKVFWLQPKLEVLNIIYNKSHAAC